MTTRVALVTGAAQGLGRSIATRLLADGWAVACADLEPGPPAGKHAISCAVDVSSVDEVAEFIGCALDAFGRIDAVVNNAGIGGPTLPAVELDPADFVRVLEVNLLGAFLVARAAVPAIIAAGRGGRIVNLGSLFGQQAVANGAAYYLGDGVEVENWPEGRQRYRLTYTAGYNDGDVVKATGSVAAPSGLKLAVLAVIDRLYRVRGGNTFQGVQGNMSRWDSLIMGDCGDLLGPFDLRSVAH